MALSSLAQRVTTAVVLVPFVVAALFLLPPRGWAVVTLAIVVLAAHEWARLSEFGLERTIGFIGGLVIIGLFLLFASAIGFSRGWPGRIVVVACGASAAFWIFAAPAWLRFQWSTRSWPSAMIVGWIVLIGGWVAIVELQARSPWLVLAALAVVWVADTAAYFTGRKLGRRKLAPSISPNKSWEGVWGGITAVALYAFVLARFSAEAGYVGTPGFAAGLAFVLFVMLLGAVSVVGDLYESLLKRQAGVKDSGASLPGHGGVLDRIDALLSALPLAAIAATLFLEKA